MKKVFQTIGLFLLYLFIISCPDILLAMIGINFNKLNIIVKAISVILIEISFNIFLIYIFRHDIIPQFKDFIKRIVYYFKNYFQYWILMIVSMIISSIIITNFTSISNSENQEIIIEEFKKFPLYTLFLTIFIAPFMEEIIFRLSLNKLIKNKYIYIIFSGLLFGLLHVIGSDNILNYLFFIPYSIPGIILAHTLVKSDNIFVPISLHFINNLFSTILLLV